MAPGAPCTNFVIDGVITLNTGDHAIVNATFDGSAVRLLFSIPCGSEDTPGGQESRQARFLTILSWTV